MDSQTLRQKFLDCFSVQGGPSTGGKHAIVPSSSLMPDDPSVLLTTAGMQQFKLYFTGKADALKDFGSLNTVSIQKSFRTSDIDEVGDESHLTFFEMLGNFSFGGYFKKEAIKYAYDFLKELGMEIEYVTIFGGDTDVPRDEESAHVWKTLGINDIRDAGREDNFWGPTGNEGPCGPTTEIYINGVEIWNIVFNQFYCNPDGSLRKSKTSGVDTGMGLERLAMIAQGKQNIFETDLFAPIIAMLPDSMSIQTKRIVGDHARASVFLLADGVRPSNKEAGYILRRLLRRIIVMVSGDSLSLKPILEHIIAFYSQAYPELAKQRDAILDEFKEERNKFAATLTRGLNELARMSTVDAANAFMLYQSFGLPYESIKEIAGEKAKSLTREEFDQEFKKHQEASRAGQEKKFGGHGLVLNTGELKAANEEEVKIVTRLHTATHLLQAALRKVLGKTVHQDGSDITAERLRFDFSFDRKLTEAELGQVEDLVNSAIQLNFEMRCDEMPYAEAIRTGALYFKKEKYPERVKLYSAVDSKTGEVFSRELCGGPHVARTEEVGRFQITKQEAVGAGVRRIRAVVFPNS